MEIPADCTEQRSILVVEDEKVTLDLLMSILALKYPAYSIHSAGDGQTGLELFRVHNPDIVITDINMAGITGVQMANKIKALKAGAKIVALTGNSEKIYLHDSDSSEYQFDAKIMKPVVFQELFSAIDRCLAENQGTDLL